MRKVYASAFVIVAVACGSSGGGGEIGGTGAVTGTGATGNGGASGSTAGGSGGGINLGGSGNDDGGVDAPTGCTPGTKSCSGQTPQFCEADGTWSQSPQCPFACNAGDCYGSCTPGTTQCKLGKTQTCGSDAEWGAKSDCEFGCDSATGGCKTGCTAGEFNCAGNTVMQCDPGPPAKWVPKAPATVCNAASGQTCDAKTGTCIACPVIGTTTPTGEYYQYSTFLSSGGIFKGGYDVTSYGDYIYVNRSGTYLDVYKVTLLDSDGDGKLEPNQHPSNPNETGPIEQRVLTFEKTILKAAPDNAPLGSASVTSLRALSNTEIHSLGPTKNGGIRLYDFATKASTTVLTPAATTLTFSFFGYGADWKMWYGGNESNRRVYSFHEPSKAWKTEFCYPNLAGSHMDGMDVVVSPKTGVEYVYVSDMTSDFIAQYRRDDAQGWVQEGLFQYTDSTSSAVEGFGFGALKHFWATGGSTLIEIGGGDIQEDLEPCPAGKQACGGSLPACDNGGICLGGCCSPNPCQNGEQYCGGGQACPGGQVCQNSCCVSQCPSGKTPCGTGLPPCPTGNACQSGCCVQIG
ncbi:MAG: hypothetical protein IPM35_13755 [Myxococcales bacterium]|nr:hypothetical protein [Myxococcales bacterium]